MSRKLIKTIGTSPQAKVYKDSEWGEYVVKLYSLDGNHLAQGDYFTGDKEDAIETAKHMVARERDPIHTRTR